MDTRESVIYEFGMNATQVEQGLLKMRAQQEMEAAKTKAIWAEADRSMAAEHQLMLDREVAAEKVFNDTLVALHAKQLEARAAADAAYRAEQAAANAAVMAGTTPEAWAAAKAQKDARVLHELEAGATIVGGVGTGVGGVAYVFKKGKLAGKIGEGGTLEKTVDEAAEGLKDMGHAAHGNAGALRESAVLIREASRGNWTRMLGSFSILLGKLWSPISKVAGVIEKIPVLNKLFGPVSAVMDLITIGGTIREFSRMRTAQAGAAESEKDLKSMSETDSERLRQRVEDLHKAGAISDHDLEVYQMKLKDGGSDNLNWVMSQTNPLLANGTAAQQAQRATQAREVAKVNAQAQQESLAAYRESVPLLTRMQSLEIERHTLQEKMTGMKKDSVEYAQAELEVQRLTLDINKSQNDLAKEKVELQKQYDEEAKRARKLVREESQIDVDRPTEEMLAGSRFTGRLNKLYGKGGRFDLSRGDGPFAGAAQQAMLAEKQEMWDIIHGNAQWKYNAETGVNELVGGQAYADKQRRMGFENMLGAAGLDTPAMKMDRMNRQLSEIGGNISRLVAAARVDGIVLADKS